MSHPTSPSRLIPESPSESEDSAGNAIPSEQPVHSHDAKIAATDSAALTIEALTAFTGEWGVRQEWDAAVERLHGPVYMTYDWLRTWWEHYGAGHRLRLIIFRSRGEVVALLPIYIESFGIGPWKTAVARLVGANLPPKTFNPPVNPQWAKQTFAALFRHLFEGERCDLLSLGPVSTTWTGSTALKNAAASPNNTFGRVRYRPYDVQTRFTLPPTFDTYLASLSSSERRNRLKRLRKLEKQASLTCDVIADREEILKEFDAFASLHAQQWHAAGKGGHFAAWPKAQEYNRVLVGRMAEAGRVRFFRMLVDGETAASRYTFLFGKRLYSELPARKVGEPWDGMGIGGTSFIKFNEAAITEGIEIVDSGLGGYDHKSQLGGVQIPVGIWRVTSPRTNSKVKILILVLLSKVVRIAVNKIWYRRIVPNLPNPVGRTQPRFWLRFDI